MSERASDPANVPLWETWGTLARTRPIAAAAVLVAVGGIATILGAWFFQYGLGLKPCPLCYEQRYPYYFAIPLAALVILGDSGSLASSWIPATSVTNARSYSPA